MYENRNQMQERIAQQQFVILKRFIRNTIFSTTDWSALAIISELFRLTTEAKNLIDNDFLFTKLQIDVKAYIRSIVASGEAPIPPSFRPLIT